jgi:hypothetical protein
LATADSNSILENSSFRALRKAEERTANRFPSQSPRRLADHSTLRVGFRANGAATPVVVNLDPHHTQSGWVRVPIQEIDIDESGTYQVHDLLSDARYLWQGEVNFVQIDPLISPAHIFRLRRKIKTERDFDYFR